MTRSIWCFQWLWVHSYGPGGDCYTYWQWPLENVVIMIEAKEEVRWGSIKIEREESWSGGWVKFSSKKSLSVSHMKLTFSTDVVISKLSNFLSLRPKGVTTAAKRFPSKMRCFSQQYTSVHSFYGQLKSAEVIFEDVLKMCIVLILTDDFQEKAFSKM